MSESRIDELELSIKAMAEYLKNHTEHIKNHVLMKEHLDEWKNEMKKKDEDIESLKGSYEELNKKVDETRSLPMKKGEKTSSIPEIYVKRIELLEKHIQDLEKKSIKKDTETEEVITVSVDKDMQEMNKKIDDLRSSVSSAQGSDKLKEEFAAEFSSIRNEINTKFNQFIGKAIESGTKSLSEAERKEILLLKVELQAMQQSVNEMRGSLENLKEMKNVDTYEDLKENITDIRRTIDDETVQRIATDRELQKMKQSLENMTVAVGKYKEFQQIDVSKLKEAINKDVKFSEELDRKINMEAAKVVTKHLNEFSRAIDRRLPNLATQDDLAKLESRLKNQPKMTYKKPDHLDERLEILEFTLNSLIEELKEKGGSGHSPSFVIE